MSNNTNRNRNRPVNQNNRGPQKPNAPKVQTTAERAKELGAAVPTDKAEVEIDYLKHPEKMEGWSDLHEPTDEISSVNEQLLKLRLGKITHRFSKSRIDAWDKNGKEVELFDKEGVFTMPVDEDGLEIALFDKDNKAIDIDAKLEEVRQELQFDAEHPEIAMIEIGELIDLLCNQFAKNPSAIRSLSRQEDGTIKIITLATLYISILGEFARSIS